MAARDMASPSQIHQAVSMQLSTAINNYILRRKGSSSIFSAPFDVKLSDDPLTIVQPDIMVICVKDKLDDKRCNGAPDFIIEIVAPVIHQTIMSVSSTTTRITECMNIGLWIRRERPSR